MRLKRIHVRFWAILAQITLLAWNVGAAEWTVCQNPLQPCDFSSVESAIESPFVQAGDTVLVFQENSFPQGYQELPLYLEKEVSLIGADREAGEADRPTIWRPYDPDDHPPILTIAAAGVEVENLIIRHGNPAQPDPTIDNATWQESPWPGVRITRGGTLRDCAILLNGVGVLIDRFSGDDPQTRALVRGCSIGAILPTGPGEAIQVKPNLYGVVQVEKKLETSDPWAGYPDRIENCQVRYNRQVGIVLTQGSRAQVHNCLVVQTGIDHGAPPPPADPEVGGILSHFDVHDCPDLCPVQMPVITGCTVDSNLGFGIRLHLDSLLEDRLYHTALIRDCIVTRNGWSGVECSFPGGSGQGIRGIVPVLRHSAVWHGASQPDSVDLRGMQENWGPALLVQQNPRFAPSSHEGWDDYYLAQGVSPAKDAGSYGVDPGVVSYQDTVDEGAIDLGAHFPVHRKPPKVGEMTVGTGAGGLTVQWSAPTVYEDGTPFDDLVGYRVTVGLDPDKPEITKVLGPETSFPLSDLVPGKTYYVSVSAYDSAGVHGETRTLKLKLE